MMHVVRICSVKKERSNSRIQNMLKVRWSSYTFHFCGLVQIIQLICFCSLICSYVSKQRGFFANPFCCSPQPLSLANFLHWLEKCIIQHCAFRMGINKLAFELPTAQLFTLRLRSIFMFMAKIYMSNNCDQVYNAKQKPFTKQKVAIITPCKLKWMRHMIQLVCDN